MNEMNADLNYKKIRIQLSPHVEKSLFKRNTLLGLLIGLILISYWPIFYMGAKGTIPLIPSAFILGIIAGFLSLASHDLLHGSVFKSRFLYQPLTLGISFLTLVSPDFWKFWHDFHHKAVDRWTSSAMPYEMGYETNGYPAMRKLIGPLELFFYKAMHLTRAQIKFIFDSKYKSRNHTQLKIQTAWQLILIFIVKIALFWILPLKQWFFLEVGALLIQNFISNTFLLSQHASSLKKENAIQTFSLKLPRLLDICSLRVSHHIEHHIFPNLPSRQLPEVKKLLKEHYPDFECVEYEAVEAFKKVY